MKRPALTKVANTRRQSQVSCVLEQKKQSNNNDICDVRSNGMVYVQGELEKTQRKKFKQRKSHQVETTHKKGSTSLGSSGAYQDMMKSVVSKFKGYHEEEEERSSLSVQLDSIIHKAKRMTERRR
jgi:hypothetical protein